MAVASIGRSLHDAPWLIHDTCVQTHSHSERRAGELTQTIGLMSSQGLVRPVDLLLHSTEYEPTHLTSNTVPPLSTVSSSSSPFSLQAKAVRGHVMRVYKLNTSTCSCVKPRPFSDLRIVVMARPTPRSMTQVPVTSSTPTIGEK